MSDLISRAEAIEVGNKIVEELALSSIDWDDLTYWAKELFDALPSADRPKGEWIDREDSKPQPYVPEGSTEQVVHCKDCIYSRQPEGEELFVCENRLGMSGWVREDEFCSSGSL